MSSRRAAVIGAGAAGIVSARTLLKGEMFGENILFCEIFIDAPLATVEDPHLGHALFPCLRKEMALGLGAEIVILRVSALAKILQNGGWTADVFEQYDVVGGTWNYDEAYLNKHSAMYKNLRTNLPKELMLFEGLKYPNENRSFLDHEEVLEYLNRYVSKFNLKHVIQFETKVTNVIRSSTGNWEVTTCHLPTGRVTTNEYEAVFVCNGHYFEPDVPRFEGADSFKGQSLHSHRYRVPSDYAGQDVLIIGSGPSGRDIAVDLAPHARKVYLSHHEADLASLGFPETVELKPDVESFVENGACFTDGSTSCIDSVIYCTGYRFSFPFLDENCCVQVDENYVFPLYRQLINIRYPTMFFIGLPFRTFIFQMLELQVKCCVRTLNHDVILPTAEEMEKERQSEVESLKKRGYPKKKYHLVGAIVKEYLASIAQLGELPQLREVFFKIYYQCGLLRKNDFMNYRNYVFKILDDHNYELINTNNKEG